MFALGKKTRQLWIAAGIALGVMTLGACSGGGGGSALAPQPNQPVPSQPQSKSVDIPWSSVGSAISLPNVAGYNESITLTDNSLKATTEKLTLTISNHMPKGVPAMPASMHETEGFLSFSLTSSKDVHLSGFPGFSLTIPPGLVWDGGLLHLGFYDPASGWVSIGDVSLKGTTMTFTPTHTSLNLKAGVQYVVLPFACTVPSPSPSPTPTGVISCTASGTGAIGVLCETGGATAKTYAFAGEGRKGSNSVEQVDISGGASGGGTGHVTHTYNSGAGVPYTACSGDEKHLRVLCGAYSSGELMDVNANTLTDTEFSSGASGALSFSGGSCTICAIAFDPLDTAFILEDPAPAGGGQFQRVGENSHTIDMSIGTSDPNENPGYDYVKNWVFNPGYGTHVLQIANFNNGKLFSTTSGVTGGEPDSAGVDVSTHVGETPDEFDDVAWLADLGTSSMSGSTLTVATGSSTLSSSSLDSSLDIDATGVDSVLHLVFYVGEFGTDVLGFSMMPTTSGGTTYSDWAFVRWPNAPDGSAFTSGVDPHQIAVFNDPANCHDCGLALNADSSWLAVVDLDKLSHAPRSASDSHSIDSTYDLVAHHVVAFYKL